MNTTQTTNHTPFTIVDGTGIRDGKGEYVCDTVQLDVRQTKPDWMEKRRQLTAFIVTAVNAHAELVEALKDAINRLEYVCSQEDKFKRIELNGRSCRDASITKARALLAKLEAENP